MFPFLAAPLHVWNNSNGVTRRLELKLLGGWTWEEQRHSDPPSQHKNQSEKLFHSCTCCFLVWTCQLMYNTLVGCCNHWVVVRGYYTFILSVTTLFVVWCPGVDQGGMRIANKSLSVLVDREAGGRVKSGLAWGLLEILRWIGARLVEYTQKIWKVDDGYQVVWGISFTLVSLRRMPCLSAVLLIDLYSANVLKQCWSSVPMSVVSFLIFCGNCFGDALNLNIFDCLLFILCISYNYLATKGTLGGSICFTKILNAFKVFGTDILKLLVTLFLFDFLQHLWWHKKNLTSSCPFWIHLPFVGILELLPGRLGCNLKCTTLWILATPWSNEESVWLLSAGRVTW